jgi:alpha-beta hydrolase superfamily lysophospholipase
LDVLARLARREWSRIMRIGKWIGAGLLALIAVYLAVATTMIAMRTSRPFEAYPLDEAAWNSGQRLSGVRLSEDVPFEQIAFAARDGARLAARVYGSDASARIVYLHGVNSSAARLNHSAGLLQEATGAQVITPDARGHGASGGFQFHVDHIGQYEEDVADIVASIRTEEPDATVYLAGHSMGGGVALRYTLLEERPAVDGFILLAPNFGDGPTQHDVPGGAAAQENPARGIVHFDARAFIGVLMYNILGITLANDTPVLYFNTPGEPAAYTYAAVMSAQPTVPKDAPAALRALDAPTLVLIGANDEVFKARAYRQFIAEHATIDVDVAVVPDHSHNTLINDSAVAGRIADWINARARS